MLGLDFHGGKGEFRPLKTCFAMNIRFIRMTTHHSGGAPCIDFYICPARKFASFQGVLSCVFKRDVATRNRNTEKVKFFRSGQDHENGNKIINTRITIKD